MCEKWQLPKRFEEAAEKGISRAIEAGAKRPLLFFQNPKEKQFPNAGTCSLLGALKAAYVPIEVRISMQHTQIYTWLCELFYIIFLWTWRLFKRSLQPKRSANCIQQSYPSYR